MCWLGIKFLALHLRRIVQFKHPLLNQWYWKCLGCSIDCFNRWTFYNAFLMPNYLDVRGLLVISARTSSLFSRTSVVLMVKQLHFLYFFMFFITSILLFLFLFSLLYFFIFLFYASMLYAAMIGRNKLG